MGDRDSENLAASLVVDKLRAMAKSLLGRERAGHTLRATALVNEIFLQKLRGLKTPILNRDHFYSLAAYAMRQVLIDHARFHSASKRRIPPDTVADLLMTSSNAAMNVETKIALAQGFEKLARIDRAAAAAIQCRFLEGLTIQETALRLNRPPKKVRGDCEFGLKWMADHL